MFEFYLKVVWSSMFARLFYISFFLLRYYSTIIVQKKTMARSDDVINCRQRKVGNANADQ